MPPTVTNTEPAALAEQFDALAARWKAETALLSSSSAIIGHPAYRAVVALGPPVIPLLLRDLEREPAHWFEALRELTGEDPVAPQHWRHIRTMTDAWLAWGRARGLI
jgi:hypothetical protein